MSSYVVVVIAACYGSLLIELTFLHVPSVASSLRIWSGPESVVSGYSVKYRRLFDLDAATKLVVIALPLAAIYAVYAYPLVVVIAGRDPLGDYLFVPTAVTNGCAIVAMLCGRGIALAAALTIRRQNAQCGISFRLHTDGVFRWSRNPGLLGMYVFATGLWIATPSATMLACIALYTLHMHVKVLMEEDFLSNKFGARYTDYRLRTRRYFP